MSTDEELQVYLISPMQIIIYSLDDPLTDIKYMFNAELLTLMKDIQVSGFKEILGNITPKFGVKPIVLGYENGKFELVYAPLGMGYVFKSDGKLACHNRSQVTLKSAPIRIFDIAKVNLTVKSDCLPELDLPEPDTEDIKKYILMSQQGIEYNINTTYDELRKPQKVNLPSSIKATAACEAVPVVAAVPAVVLPPLSQTSMPQQYDDVNLNTPIRAMKSPSPRISKPKASADAVTINKSSVTDQEIEKLKIEVAELRSIVKVFLQRNYQLYPIEMPEQLRLDNISGPVVKLEEINKKMANKEIADMKLDPLLQPYAGSNRGNNRLLTFIAKDGKLYHVRASYDPKNNKIDEPK